VQTPGYCDMAGVQECKGLCLCRAYAVMGRQHAGGQTYVHVNVATADCFGFLPQAQAQGQGTAGLPGTASSAPASSGVAEEASSLNPCKPRTAEEYEAMR
jgi:hypothetical protein